MKEIIDELERLNFGYWDEYYKGGHTRTYHFSTFLLTYKDGDEFLTYDTVLTPIELSGKKVYTLEQFRKDYEWYLDYMIKDAKNTIERLKKNIKFFKKTRKEYVKDSSVHL